MAVTAAMVKELRESTGAGMSDCKNALVAADGDMEKAIEVLREKGLAAAAKKSGRIASEGLVYASITDDNKIGVVVEVNSETDFVAKNKDFQAYVAQVAKQAMESKSLNIEDFHDEKWHLDANLSVREALSTKIAIIGENLSIRRFEKFVKEKNGAIVSYIHGGGRVAVMLDLTCEKDSPLIAEAGKNICMQIAAMSPKFVRREEISEEFIQKERETLTQQALNDEKNAGKPQNILEKMVEGRLNKELKDFCLNEQEYVKDGDLTVLGYLAAVSKEIGAPLSIEAFVRYETGEGIEKKEENFADEVNKVMQG